DDGAVRSADFDLAGMVRVRVIGGDAQVALVGRQLGLPRTEPVGEPDLTVRFTDDVVQGEAVRYLGLDEAAFTDSRFLHLRAKAKARAMVHLPFDEIGKGMVISCEPNLPAVPLLIPLLAVTALHRGLVPLHAGAIQWRGAGIVFTGWSKSGKTETLIATTAAGADYVGDEWCYLDPARSTVVGIPEPVTLWSWHLRRFPSLRDQVPNLTRQRMRLLETPDRLERSLPATLQQSGAGRLLRRVAYQTRSRANAWIPPEELFGVTDARAVPFEHVVWTVSTESSEVRLTSLPATEIAERMIHSVYYELSPLLQAYRMFRFAFPDRRSDLLDNLEDHLTGALHDALDGVRGWRLEHPYELDLGRLSDELSPLAGGSESSGEATA
ncbi:MAG: hypothetical protein OEW83_18170, partial [Acidimicrobiia bacterium]|nr:hypothetical protein [Acidimicrobiia bacterium]